MIYLDNHATTRTDPNVVAAMRPYWETEYANPGSVTHEAGRNVADRVDQAIAMIANHFGASSSEIIITSGATESNNLAIFGACLFPRQKRRRIVSLATEHRAVLDPLLRLETFGFDVVRLPVLDNVSPFAGKVDVERLAAVINQDTALVTVMLANNEIGVIQPLAEIAKLCHRHDVVLHTDASQAVGRIPVHVDSLDVDLLSFSAHKFYGPKGIGGLYVRNRGRRVRLQSQILGGGQQHNIRSGTLNSVGIVGMATAISICQDLAESEQPRVKDLRDQLWSSLRAGIPEVSLNGPPLVDPTVRLSGNLNCQFPIVEGQSLMSGIPQLAVSSGSACTSAEPYPSHVLQAIGLSEDASRSSLRFGVGRFNTVDEIRTAAELLIDRYSHILGKFG